MVPLTPSSVSSSASTSRDTSFQADSRPDGSSSHIPHVAQDDDFLAQQRLDKFVDLVYDRLNARTNFVPSLAERLKAIETCLGIETTDDSFDGSNGASRKQRNHLTEVRDKSRLTAALFSTISSLTARLDEAEAALDASATAYASHEVQLDRLGQAVSINTFLAQQLASNLASSKLADVEPTTTMLALQQALGALRAQIQRHETRSKNKEEEWSKQNGQYELRLGQVKKSRFHLTLQHASPREPLPRSPVFWPDAPVREKDVAPLQAVKANVEPKAPANEPKTLPDIVLDSTAVDPPSSQPSSSDLSDPSSIYTPPLKNASLIGDLSSHNDVNAEPTPVHEQPSQVPSSPFTAEASERTGTVATSEVGSARDDSAITLAGDGACQSKAPCALASDREGLHRVESAERSNNSEGLAATAMCPSPVSVASQPTKPQRKVSFELRTAADERQLAGPSDSTRKIVGVLKNGAKLQVRPSASTSSTSPSWLLSSRPSQLPSHSGAHEAQPASVSGSTNNGQRKTKVLPPKLPSASGSGQEAKSNKVPVHPVSGNTAHTGASTGAPGPTLKSVSEAAASNASVKEQLNKQTAATDASNQDPFASKKRRHEEESMSKEARQKQGTGASCSSATAGPVKRSSSSQKRLRRRRRAELLREMTATPLQPSGDGARREGPDADTWWELPLSQSSASSQSSRQASGTSAQGSAATAKSKETGITKEQVGSNSSQGHRSSDYDLWGSAAGSSPCPQ